MAWPDPGAGAGATEAMATAALVPASPSTTITTLTTHTLRTTRTRKTTMTMVVVVRTMVVVTMAAVTTVVMTTVVMTMAETLEEGILMEVGILMVEISETFSSKVVMNCDWNQKELWTQVKLRDWHLVLLLNST